MYSFIIVLDRNEDRRAKSMIQAKEAMKHYLPEESAAEIPGRGISIAVWGKTKLYIHDQTWRLSVGSLLFPDSSSSIPALWDHAAHDTLNNYDGTYCFLAGELQNPGIHAVTDPVGRMHVFYAKPYPDTWIVSNSSLLLATLTDADWDHGSVRELLAKGTIFDQKSLYLGIRKFAPGGVHHLHEGGMDFKPLTTPSPPPAHDTKQLIEKYCEVITESTSRIFKTHANPVLDLTGGFDSRLLLASLLQSRSGADISTVVVGRTSDRDVLVASAIARRFGLRHKHIEPVQTRDITEQALYKSAFLCDSSFDILEYAKIMHIQERLSQEFDASINGSGGGIMRDEWLQVFDRCCLPNHRWNSARLAVRRFATDPWAEHIIKPAPRDTLTEHFSRLIDKLVEKHGGEGTQQFVDEALLYMRIQHWQGRISSATHGIWPNYSPYLMRKPLAMALNVPSALRRNGLMHRLVLERMNYPLAKMPMANGSPATAVRMANLLAHIPAYMKAINSGIKAIRRRIPGIENAPRQPELSDELPSSAVSMVSPSSLSAELFDKQHHSRLIDELIRNEVPIHHAGRLITLEFAARQKQRIRPSYTA